MTTFTIDTVVHPGSEGAPGTVSGKDQFGRSVRVRPQGTAWENFKAAGVRIGDAIAYDEKTNTWTRTRR